MDLRVIERLFIRFKEKGFDTKNLNKEEWRVELSTFKDRLDFIKFGLNNLKGELPDAKTFAKMCSPIYKESKEQTFYDNKQWARDILKKVEQGIQVRPICLTFAKEALRIKENYE